jgi:hypothetical protein
MAERIEVALDGITAVKFSDKPFKIGGVKHFPKWEYSDAYKKHCLKAGRAMLRGNSDLDRTRMYNAWKERKAA